MSIVSVIVPAYNAAKFLAATIESVLAQTVPTWELIVVDDGSSDDTAAVAEQFAAQDVRVQLVRQAHRGLSSARNAGFARIHSHSSSVIFLDADDVWDDDALQVLTAALEAEPVVGAYGLARYINEEGKPIRIGEAEQQALRRKAIVGEHSVLWPPHRPTTFGVLALGNCIHTPGQVLVRRQAVESSGGFDEALRSAEDWDLWLRITARGDFALVRHVVIGYRRHGNNLSNDTRRVASSFRAVRRKLAYLRDLSVEQRRVLRLAKRCPPSAMGSVVRRCAPDRMSSVRAVG